MLWNSQTPTHIIKTKQLIAREPLVRNATNDVVLDIGDKEVAPNKGSNWGEFLGFHFLPFRTKK